MALDSEEKTARINEKLVRELGEFKKYLLHDESVSEIMLNPDGKVWIQQPSGGAQCVGSMNRARAQSFLSTVASTLGTVIGNEHPTIDGTLQVSGSRISGQLPPISMNPTFTIRKHSSKRTRLSWFVDKGTMSKDQFDYIVNAIANKKNIIVVGSTGSGKTFLVNSLLNELSYIAPNDRVLTIEDVNELSVCNENFVSWYTSSTRTLLDLLHLSLRANPTRVMVGEVRGGEAYQMLKLWRTGHSGGFSTIHADLGPLDGLERLELMSAESHEGGRLGAEWIKKIIANAVDVLIPISLDDSGIRKIRTIVEVNGYREGEYKINTIEN